MGRLAIVDGTLTVSDEPGLGFDIDWERVEKTAVARA
jgi:L-alanine-DL-glutamate epimerase-like enolase superfamily enzyme